jgi:glutathione S-transferase
VNRRLVGKQTVPVLVDSGNVIGDSTAIALYLEHTYGGPALLPSDPAERDRTLELEEYFDETFGPAVRRWMYGQAIETSGLIPKLFFSAYGDKTRRFAKPFLGRILTESIRRMYRINPQSVERSSEQIDRAADRLEELIERDPRRHLVGDRLSLADITAASLLGPLVGPPRSPWETLEDPPAIVAERRKRMRDRAAGQWVIARYSEERTTPS